MCTYVVIFTTETDHPCLKSPPNGLVAIRQEDGEEQDRAEDGWFHSLRMLKADLEWSCQWGGKLRRLQAPTHTSTTPLTPLTPARPAALDHVAQD